MPKWIEFVETTKEGAKTKRFDIYSIDQNVIIGEIKWFGAWRQYCFFPRPDTIFEKTCLTDITNYLVQLNKERKV